MLNLLVSNVHGVKIPNDYLNISKLLNPDVPLSHNNGLSGPVL